MFFNILRVFTTYLLPFMNNFLKKLGNLLKYCEVQFILTRLLIIIIEIILMCIFILLQYWEYNK